MKLGPLQNNYKTWYYMPPSPTDAAQSGGKNEKKKKNSSWIAVAEENISSR